MIVVGDALDLPVRPGSVHCVVTSPPYFGLRVYGDSEAEIGRGDLEQYMEQTRAWTRRVWDALRDDGLFWLNIGDKAAGSGGSGGDYNKGGTKEGRRKYGHVKSGVKPMSWIGVPDRVGLMLRDEGWLVRATVIWDKGAPRREDQKHVRRPLINYETIFMLAKHRDHRYYPQEHIESGNVWHFAARPARRGHQAPFPFELPSRCVQLSTLPGDIVLDPFVGSGTTVHAAHALGRRGIGVELYEAEARKAVVDESDYP